MPYFFAKVVLLCMFNDLAMKKDLKTELDRQGGLDPGAGGDPLLEAHRRDMTLLARVLPRLPTSSFV